MENYLGAEGGELDDRDWADHPIPASALDHHPPAGYSTDSTRRNSSTGSKARLAASLIRLTGSRLRS